MCAASLSHVRAASSCVRGMEGLGHAGNAVVISKPRNGLKSGEVSEAMKKREKAMIDKTGRTIQLCALWLTGTPAAPIREKLPTWAAGQGVDLTRRWFGRRLRRAGVRSTNQTQGRPRPQAQQVLPEHARLVDVNVANADFS